MTAAGEPITQAGHWTMRPRPNIVLTIVWTFLLLFLLAVTRPLPWVSLAMGLACGGVAGELQRRSFQLSSDALFRATTAREIRETLRSRAPGKLYIAVYWIFSVFFVLLPMLRVGWMGSYAFMAPLIAHFAFTMVRDGLTLVPILRMTQGTQPR